MAGVYVHFPFCASRCIYCDFYARVGKDWKPYIEALCREISLRKQELKGVPPTTLYFGGGTPSILPAEALGQVAEACSAPTGHLYDEFTIEVNPDDVTPEKAASLRSLGANRISMGVQSFCDRHLKWMGRRHDAGQAEEAFHILRGSGFDNLSIDLIFGFTGLADDEWEYSIAKAIELHPEHISCYQMMGRWSDAEQERCWRQYTMLQKRLAEAGYRQYEISNYSLPGFESRHNSAYWARAPYLGVGAGAHSFDGDRLRSWNTPDIDAYIESRPGGSETLSDNEILEEKLMLSLRTVRGLKWETLSAEEASAINKTTLEELSRAGKLVLEPDGFRIPENELFVSDGIIGRLFP